MALEDVSEEVLEYVKSVGKTSGGKVQAALKISEGAYKQAKEKLNRQGLVRLGRGRGGTIEAIDGAVAPPEPKKLSQAEVMEIAREEKASKSRLEKEIAAITKKALEVAEKEHPEADKIDVQVWNIDLGEVYVYPWYGKSAQTYRVFV
jgi:uncharacterized protein YicC (UPF0701 family)